MAVSSGCNNHNMTISQISTFPKNHVFCFCFLFKFIGIYLIISVFIVVMSCVNTAHDAVIKSSFF